MKSRLLIIFGILTIFSISVLFTTESAYAMCIPSFDWDDIPCYGCPGCYPGLEQEKLDWVSYYDFKGAEWMDAKKQQLKNIIQNNSLNLWYQQTDSGENYNVHKYYFLQGEVPNRYGYNFEEALDFEKVWDTVENSSRDAPALLWNYHDVILEGTIIETDIVQTISGNDVPLHTIKVIKYFKGEKNAAIITAIDNTYDVEINLFQNGLFYLKKIESQNIYSMTIASVQTFGNCNARELIEISYALPNEKRWRSVPVGYGTLVDSCVPDYYDVDPNEKKSVDYSLEPKISYFLKEQIKKGWDIESFFCHNNQVLILKITDESPACVNSETKEKLLERGWSILTPKERLYDIEKILNEKDCLEFGRWLDEFVQGNFNENNLIFDLPISDELSERIYDSIPYCLDIDNGGFFKLNTKHFMDFDKLKKPNLKPYSIDEKYREHYEIEIIGLKDEYVLGEEYSFYFVISGYGHECAVINVSYPDENGELQGWVQEPLCAPNPIQHDFEINFTDREEFFGNITIKNSGTYTVSVIFDQPNKYYPTISTQEFRVVEK